MENLEHRPEYLSGNVEEISLLYFGYGIPTCSLDRFGQWIVVK
jgi:hypothetical protein